MRSEANKGSIIVKENFDLRKRCRRIIFVGAPGGHEKAMGNVTPEANVAIVAQTFRQSRSHNGIEGVSDNVGGLGNVRGMAVTCRRTKRISVRNNDIGASDA